MLGKEALGAICFAIGWKMMGNDGIVGNPYKTSKGVSPIPTSSVYMDSATHIRCHAAE